MAPDVELYPALWIAPEGTSSNAKTFDLCNSILSENSSIENILTLHENARFSGEEESTNITKAVYEQLIGCSEKYKNTKQGVEIAQEIVSFSENYGTEEIFEGSLEYAINKLYNASDEWGKTYLAVEAASKIIDYAKQLGSVEKTTEARNYALQKSIEVSNSQGDNLYGTLALNRGIEIAETSPDTYHMDLMAEHLTNKVKNSEELEFVPESGAITSKNSMIYLGKDTRINEVLARNLKTAS